MFEYVGLLSTAKITNRSPLLGPNYNTMRKIFKLSVPATTNSVTSLFRGTPLLYIGPHLNDAIQRCRKHTNHSGNLKLIAWTHDYRYFENFSSEVRDEFRLRRRVRDHVDTFFRRHKLLGNDTLSIVKVGVHVRRGDAMQKHWINRGMTPPPTSFFTNAMTYFTSRFTNVYFVICTNDLKWSVANLAGDNVVFSNNTNAGLDMAILSSCDHIIIAQGTFSWWAGWLNKGITVRYSKLPNKGFTYNASEIWPPNSTYNHYVLIDS